MKLARISKFAAAVFVLSLVVALWAAGAQSRASVKPQASATSPALDRAISETSKAKLRTVKEIVYDLTPSDANYSQTIVINKKKHFVLATSKSPGSIVKTIETPRKSFTTKHGDNCWTREAVSRYSIDITEPLRTLTGTIEQNNMVVTTEAAGLITMMGSGRDATVSLEISYSPATYRISSFKSHIETTYGASWNSTMSVTYKATSKAPKMPTKRCK